MAYCLGGPLGFTPHAKTQACVRVPAACMSSSQSSDAQFLLLLVVHCLISFCCEQLGSPVLKELLFQSLFCGCLCNCVPPSLRAATSSASVTALRFAAATSASLQRLTVLTAGCRATRDSAAALSGFVFVSVVAFIPLADVQAYLEVGMSRPCDQVKVILG